jgi:SAM-dependent methyltransferase
MGGALGSLPWAGDTLLDFGHVEVELCIPPALYERQSVPGHFILGKSRGMVENLQRATAHLDVRNVVDVGVYKGGSIVLLNEMYRPRRLVGIDIDPRAPAGLREYCLEPSRKDALGMYLGVNQADRAKLAEICDAEFGDQPVDLVVDDASHYYAETRETFRALVPRLRPRGIYVIEDWGWAHWPGDFWQVQRGGPGFRDRPPLSNLLQELMLLCASAQPIVRRVSFDATVIVVERGDGPVVPDFEPRDHCLNRGDPVTPIGERPAPARYESAPITIRTS